MSYNSKHFLEAIISSSEMDLHVHMTLLCTCDTCTCMTLVIQSDTVYLLEEF